MSTFPALAPNHDYPCIAPPSDLVFPSFDDSCDIDEDCALVSVTLDCAGSLQWTGVNSNDELAFEAAADICIATLIPCDSVPHNTDDYGHLDSQFSANGDVRCVDHVCVGTLLPGIAD